MSCGLESRLLLAPAPALFPPALSSLRSQVGQKDPKFCKQGDSVIVRIKMSRPICVERYKDFSQMGRFMLRDQVCSAKRSTRGEGREQPGERRGWGEGGRKGRQGKGFGEGGGRRGKGRVSGVLQRNIVQPT